MSTRRASAICGLWKIYFCTFIPNCTRKIMWSLLVLWHTTINLCHALWVFVTHSSVKLLQLYWLKNGHVNSWVNFHVLSARAAWKVFRSPSNLQSSSNLKPLRFCCRSMAGLLTVSRWVWEIPRTLCHVYLHRTPARRAENSSNFTDFLSDLQRMMLEPECQNIELKSHKTAFSTEEDIHVQLHVSDWV